MAGNGNQRVVPERGPTGGEYRSAEGRSAGEPEASLGAGGRGKAMTNDSWVSKLVKVDMPGGLPVWHAWRDIERCGTWVQVGDSPEARRFFGDREFMLAERAGHSPIKEWIVETQEYLQR